MTEAAAPVEPLLKLCQSDNWGQVLDDPAPHAVRWATRQLGRMFNAPDWSKWHYTEGNGFFTACGRPVVPFEVDGSPQEGKLERVNCRSCRSKMYPFTSLLAKMEAGTATSDDVGPQWQLNYRREYARTSGQSATFTPMEKGGWTTLVSTHEDGREGRTRVRKGKVLDMIERLRARPNHPSVPDEDEPESEHED